MTRPSRRRSEAPAVLGRLVGTTLAIPTSALAYCAAGYAGAGLGTAVTRAVAVGLGTWMFAGLLTRILAVWMLRRAASPAAATPGDQSA